jgi:diguanylate cyclase (GGDEF)-like protein
MNSVNKWRLGATPVAWWAVWVVSVLVSLTLVLGVARVLVDRQLLHNGEEEAENWVTFVQGSVPELEAGLGGSGFTPAARERLLLLSTADEVFRFKLFDLRGRLVLDSRQLASDTEAPAVDPEAMLVAREVADAGDEHVQVHYRGQAGFPEVYSEAYVPIEIDARRVGVFKVFIDQTERAQGIGQAFALLCALVVLITCALAAAAGWAANRKLRDKLRTEDRLRYLASHDVLSGTLNRASFVDLLKASAWRQQRGGAGFAVLCIDLDRFKEVNDGQGHATGDEVLRKVGERLRAVLRQGDAVARLGGDEFAVLQAGVQRPDDVARLAQRIVEVLGEPFDCAGTLIRCGASVGAALFEPGIEDTELLMKQADAAMYQAKAAGRGRYSFFDAQVEAQMEDRRALARELRNALAQGELSLKFQGLFGNDGHSLLGYEALMRWTHPSRGEVPPSLFIPLAEESGLIVELGAWALRQACHEAALWPAPLHVAVNLSAAQFQRGDLEATVAAALAGSGLPPQRLELEITESLLISNTQQVIETLGRLSATGVRVAMDDFGTGYSSLAYLWQFPFDKIKIDRAFVKDLSHDPKVDLIVKSIVELAHALQIRVTGEGVETAEQLQALRRHGCDEVQGYLLARPAVADALHHHEDHAKPASAASALSPALKPALTPALTPAGVLR